MDEPAFHPRIKVCGLTRPEDAAFCESLEIEAVGFVFYEKRPRFIECSNARDIGRSLSNRTARVGVFVDETYDHVMSIADCCGLTAVQLHGRETPELVMRLRNRNLTVIKALFLNKSPGFESAPDYPASAFLVECAGGPLPGGNALAWNWADALALGKSYPLILAGGLTAENVGQAIEAARPDAVDASSSLEISSGRKDADKIRRFVKAVRKTSLKSMPRRIFECR